MANLDKIKISGVTYDIIDATAIHSMDGYWTSGQTTDAITAATSALAETIGQEMSAKTDNDDFTAYTAATDAVLTGKADTTAVTQAISEATSGKADTTAVTQAISEAVSGKADTTAVTQAITEATSGMATSAEYDSASQSIKFYNGVSEVYSVDATDFVKDGFLSGVTLENRTISGESVPCLVFEWNTDAGIQETVIPVGGVFDPTNYYTKDEADAAILAATSGKADTTAVTQAISEAVSGKADTTAVTQSISEATSGKADTTAVTQSISEATSGKVDTTTYTAYTAATDTALAGKQETLVNQTNIKSINGNSLLGSGDLTIDTGNKVEVSGTTLVFL